jgi:hypothetical protein
MAQKHNRQPVPFRRAFGWIWRNIRRPPPWKRIQWRWQRSRRGWAECDWWSLDSYITKVLAGALTAMADKGIGYPGVEPWDTYEKWGSYLRDLAARLCAWNDDTWTDADAIETTRAAMEEFGKNLPYFWD